jgi:hypothetical protein
MAAPLLPDARRATYGHWHARLLHGDEGALEALAVMLLQDLARMIRPGPAGDADAVGDAIDKGILAYADHPERFDPLRNALPAYVAALARHKLSDRRRHERAQRRAEFNAGQEHAFACAIGHAAGNRWTDLRRLLATVCTSTERRLLFAWYSRRPLGELVAILGLDAGRSVAELQADVARAVERILTRLRRHAAADPAVNLRPHAKKRKRVTSGSLVGKRHRESNIR